ncbi:hypothetical protein BB561_000244 [Smittium simulii]|uniref:Uncharacterized protein n=1 Tax=Smittium simulii TaxID=133385 RepID=A0A2T9YZT5_9FUNG|nr:hypothetical protein BB561_000244 [Smittium simulii]
MIPNIKKHMDFSNISDKAQLNLDAFNGLCVKLDVINFVTKITMESSQLIQASFGDIKDILGDIEQIRSEIINLNAKLSQTEQLYQTVAQSDRSRLLAHAGKNIKASADTAIKSKQDEYNALEQKYRAQLVHAQTEYAKTSTKLQTTQFTQSMSSYKAQKEQDFWAQIKVGSQPKTEFLKKNIAQSANNKMAVSTTSSKLLEPKQTTSIKKLGNIALDDKQPNNTKYQNIVIMENEDYF